ncbi:MAG TPA: class I SAM-dependent methyltransferase [Bryobacteraceae bacterium]|nr:class I SAM-dependent methyltransferase [Bryobacteraceae bacterium]
MSNPYDAVAYPGFPFLQSHPSRLCSLSTLFGLHPAPIDHCRVLELGCADGGNVIPMAFDLRGSEFLGLELAETAVQKACRQIDALKLTNIRVEQMDLLDVEPEKLGVFDYVIAHGVYSWVPDHVREKLMAIMKACLAPEGIAYISYNALPGCRVRQMFRDMMQFHVRNVTEPEERISQSQELMRCFIEAYSGPNERRLFLKDEAQVMIDQGPVLLFHDELEETYHAIFFHDFVNHAERYGLQFVAEAHYYDMQPGRVPEAVVAQIDQFGGGNRILRDQYLDFIKCRTFRHSVLCHAGLKVLEKPQPGYVRTLHAASQAVPVSAHPSLKLGVAEEFRGTRGSAVKTAHPLAKAVLLVLTRVWPETRSFEAICSDVRQMLGEEPDQDEIAEILLATYTSGVIEFQARPLPCVAAVSRRPTATELARLQARQGKYITTTRHMSLEVDGDVERHIITLLDGTRDLPALARELAPLVRQPENIVAKEFESNLAKLAKLGMLVA